MQAGSTILFIPTVRPMVQPTLVPMAQDMGYRQHGQFEGYAGHPPPGHPAHPHRHPLTPRAPPGTPHHHPVGHPHPAYHEDRHHLYDGLDPEEEGEYMLPDDRMDRQRRRDRAARDDRRRSGRDRDDSREFREMREPRERRRDRSDRDRERSRDRYMDDDRGYDRRPPPDRRLSEDRVPDPYGQDDWSSKSWEDEGRDGRGERGDYRDDYSGGRRSDSSRSERRSSGSQAQDDRKSRQQAKHSNWRDETPSATILLKALPPHADRALIRAEVIEFGDAVKDVRLMKRKDTGASRGFAFVEFHNVLDAQRWMEQCQGTLMLEGQHKVYMHYSNPRQTQTNEGRQSREGQGFTEATDWTCIMCGTHNFKKRDRCFKCNVSKEVSSNTTGVDGGDQVGTNPCNTLIVRGLDALTTEEKLAAALSTITALTIKNIKIMLDSNHVSMGYAFVEMNSIRESTQLLETVSRLNQPLEVDGKGVIISYAKNTFSTIMVSLSQYQQQGSEQQQGMYYDQASGLYYDQTSGQYYDPTTGQYYDYNTIYAQQQGQDSNVATQSDSTNAAAAVAQAAIQQAQAVKKYQKQVEDKVVSKSTEQSPQPAATEQAATVMHEGQEYQIYPTPDVSTYQYDETSGYYYDASTGLYYDAGSQYYYNSQTGSYLYWDAEKSTYLPAPADALQGEGDGTQDTKVHKEKEKKEKGKFARKIAKDMEKWAKTLNARKEAMKDFKKAFQPVGGEASKSQAGAADAGFAILEKSKADLKAEDKMFLIPPPPGPGAQREANPSGLVASYGGDSDEEEEEMEDPLQAEESKLLDWTKMACLLCKRQFPSKEGLQRHIQLSDLHKKNVEDLRKAKGLPEAGTQQKQYRDRAQERRNKYGIADPPLRRKNKRPEQEPVPFEQPTKEKVPSDNIGNKLMQKMGWSEGQGLGMRGQGRTDPIQAQRRNAQAGLGARGSTVVGDPGDTYRDTVKKMMFSRYHEAE